MKLYIWEGGRISDAYHNDGTLIVLAESPEQARELVRAVAVSYDDPDWYERKYADNAPEGARWDGDDEALDRDPDRIVELTVPAVVSFNGGGYD